MNKERCVEIVCRGRDKTFFLFLHYVRKAIYSQEKDFFLTFKHYRFKLRIDNSNHFILLDLLNQNKKKSNTKKMAVDNLINTIRFGRKTAGKQQQG
jgi:hypothetical protein